MTTDGLDDAILETLTQEIRVLTVDQVSSVRWVPEPLNRVDVAERLQRLEAVGLITLQELLARPETDVSSPRLVWRPDSASTPRFGKIAYGLKTRWTRPPEPTRIVAATAAAKRRYGGYGPAYRPRADELTHDIHVGRLWMRYRGDLSERLRWIGEDRLRTEGTDRDSIYGGRVPDAVLRTSRDAPPTMIVEFAGSYAKPKLQQIHRAFRPHPYTLW